MLFTEQSTSSAMNIRQFLYRVYIWMGIALALSGAVAYAVGRQPGLISKIALQNPFVFFGILITQVIFVVVFRQLVIRLDYAPLALLFVGYSALTGLSLSVIFLVYTAISIYQTFFVTAGTFVLMALYGYFTRTDLSSLRSFLIMGLLGMISATIINIFWANTTFDLVIAAAGVLIFVALTAVDVQTIKLLGEHHEHDDTLLSKYAIAGALTLYLDFLNLFLSLLRFMGRQNK